MASVPKISIDLIAPQIEAFKGNITGIANAFGVSRNTIYNYIKAHPELEEKVQEARESMLDHAESSLHRAIINGEGWAVCFFLKTQGKKRGYIERQEITGKDGEPIGEVRWSFADRRNGHSKAEPSSVN